MRRFRSRITPEALIKCARRSILCTTALWMIAVGCYRAGDGDSRETDTGETTRSGADSDSQKVDGGDTKGLWDTAFAESSDLIESDSAVDLHEGTDSETIVIPNLFSNAMKLDITMATVLDEDPPDCADAEPFRDLKVAVIQGELRMLLVVCAYCPSQKYEAYVAKGKDGYLVLID